MERTVLLKYLKIYLDTDLKIILLDCENNYEVHWLLERQNFCSIAGKRFLHNYFSSTKLFSDLYLTKFSDTLIKLFFSEL